MRTIEISGKEFHLMENVVIFKGTDREQTFNVAEDGLEDFMQEAIENDRYDRELAEISDLYLWTVPLEDMEEGYDAVVCNIEEAIRMSEEKE